MLPKFWIAARCLTITFCRAIRTAPCASVTAVIIGRNSGVSPTASATANSSDSNGVAVQRDADEQDEQHEEEDRAHDQAAEPPRAALELRLGRLSAQARGDVAERRRAARRRHARESPCR